MPDAAIHILLVEDNPGDALLIRKMLADSELHAEITHVQTLAECLDYLQQQTADLLLLDLGLPDSNGMETAICIRQVAPFQTIIILTGLDDDHIALEAAKHGVQDYLIKSGLTSKTLQRVTRYALERRQLEQSILKNEERLNALLEVSQYQAKNIQDLLDFALQKVIDITDSSIGYIYHYSEKTQEFVLNSWSKEVMPSCKVANPESIYHLEKTGIWGEVVRQRRPILINDFAAPDPLKKGYPEGHVHLKRFLTVPIFDSHQQIVAVVGVANKQLPYTETDALQLSLMLDGVWKISKRLELELQISRSGHEWQVTFDAITDSIALIDADHRIVRCNLASKQLFQGEFKDIIGQRCCKLLHGVGCPIENCPMVRAKQSLKTESQIIKQGRRWFKVTVDPIVNQRGELTGAVHIVHDDTERKQAEESLKELLSMLEAVHNEIYVFDPTTLQFEYVNQSALVNLGYTMEQLRDMTPLDLKPGFAPGTFTSLLSTLQTNDPNVLNFETCHRRADGSTYPVEVNLQMVDTHSGRKCLSVIHDITERKRFIDSLQESEALVNSVMNSLKSSIAVINADGTIIRVNQAWSQFAQENNGSETLQEGVGLNYLDVCRKALIEEPAVKEIIEGIISVQKREQTSYAVEYPCHSPDMQRWFVMYATPVENTVGSVALTHLNITDRKQAEIALFIEKTSLETASVAGNIALWDWDVSTGRLSWTSVVDRMLRMESEGLPRRIESWQEIIHPDDRERVALALTMHFKQNTPFEIDYRVRTADGGYIEWHVVGQSYRDASGRVTRMTGSCIDITQRKQAEEELRELQRQLMQNEKMASIGQLSAGIAHEINNPMGFIYSNLGTLEKYVTKFDRYISNLEALVQQSSDNRHWQVATELRNSLKLDYVQRDIRQLIDESTDGAERVMKIVQDLKTFSRSDTSKVSTADINQCLDSTINIVWNQIKYVADLVREYGALPKVSCNVQQINQVFLNLLVNAAHAIQAKGEETPGMVTIRTWADHENVYIAVSDSGCGMTDEVKHRIFDPFFTTKDVGLGTGLGLSISHEIIKKHNGEIVVESEVDKGTTFTVRLPLVTATTAP